jgi:hypothetical protein
MKVGQFIEERVSSDDIDDIRSVDNLLAFFLVLVGWKNLEDCSF